jgi:serine/threonine-protein kinase
MSDAPDRLASALAHRYPIERKIGSGGMATVYLARDLKHNRLVALKVFHREYASGIGVDRFLREIEIAAKMVHPHILPLYDSGEAEGYLYYTMPYAEGESLGDRLRREGRLTLEDSISIARQVADALSYAHNQGIVHRDIKPENILLEQGEAVVADFGIARAVTVAAGSSLTGTGIVIGSAPYMSPEQAAGEHDLDGRSDIYSLGCVLYEMLTGRPPFTGQSLRAIVVQHISQSPPAARAHRHEVPPWLDSLVSACLAKRPAERPACAASLSQTLADQTAPRFRSRQKPLGVSRRWFVPVLGLSSVFLTIILARFVYLRLTNDSLEGQTASDLDRPRIAVLYLEDRSRDNSLGWLASGLTEELIDRLHEAGSIDVTSRYGVMPFAGKIVPPDSIGRRLSVGTLVEGTVEPITDRIQVKLYMVDAASGDLLDSFSVDESLSDLRSLRSEVADMLARMLRGRLGQQISLAKLQDETDSDMAWREVTTGQKLCAEGRELAGARRFEVATLHFEQADSAFARAVTYDRGWHRPQIERGWLAMYRAFLAIRAGEIAAGEPNPEAADWYRVGIAHSENVLQNKPNDITALELRGVLRFRLAESAPVTAADSLLASALEDLSAVTQRDASRARAWYTLAALHLKLGQLAESRFAAEEALAADVFAEEAGQVLEQLYYASLYNEDYGAAERWCWQGQRHDPADEDFLECTLYVLGWAASSEEQATQAWLSVERLDSVPKLAEGWAHRRLMVAAILARAGRTDSARAVISGAYAGVPESKWRQLGFMEAYVRSALGEHTKALELLSSHLDSYPQDVAYVARHPWFKQLREIPEFQQLVSERPSAN